ncbi:type II toxin-antitoxin system HicA family toxin [bacterium]|nr:type II toxin-antitoxin system HicA family toxin [bacterium]
MSHLPLLTAKKFERLLFRLGFEKIRHVGSHARYRHADGRNVSLPFHTGTFSKSLTMDILRTIKLTHEEYDEMVRRK